MNFTKASVQELALIVHALRAVHVADMAKLHGKMLADAEAALAAKGARVVEAA